MILVNEFNLWKEEVDFIKKCLNNFWTGVAATAASEVPSMQEYTKQKLVQLGFKSDAQVLDNGRIMVIAFTWLVHRVQLCDHYVKHVLRFKQDLSMEHIKLLPHQQTSDNAALKQQDTIENEMKTSLSLLNKLYFTVRALSAEVEYSSKLRSQMVYFNWTFTLPELAALTAHLKQMQAATKIYAEFEKFYNQFYAIFIHERQHGTLDISIPIPSLYNYDQFRESLKITTTKEPLGENEEDEEAQGMSNIKTKSSNKQSNLQYTQRLANTVSIIEKRLQLLYENNYESLQKLLPSHLRAT